MKYLLFLIFFWGCQDNYYINKEPEQVNIEKERLVIHTKSLGDCELTKIAKFSIEARVLSKRDYTSDFDGELNPYNLAVGWKKMSSFEILNQLKIFHSSRFYYFQASEEPVGITFQEALEQSANIHLIPANEDILEQIEGIFF